MGYKITYDNLSVLQIIIKLNMTIGESTDAQMLL
jgi:hypothetical protein